MVIHSRAILATVSYMFDSALVAYGIILYRFHPKYNSRWLIGLMFLAAIVSHGIYDFIVMVEIPFFYSFLAVTLYFLLTVSLFAVILNNALNNSDHFHYGKMHNPHRLIGRLLYGYAVVFGLAFVALAVDVNLTEAIYGTSAAVLATVASISITSVRLSRFKLVKQRWEPLKLELLFEFGSGSNSDVGTIMPSAGFYGINISIKGDNYNEYYLNGYYQAPVSYIPVTRRKSYLGRVCHGAVQSKHFFENLESAYSATVVINGKPESYLLKPKLRGKVMAKNNIPIVALLKPQTEEALQNERLNRQDFTFCEWLYLLPAKKGK